MIKTKKELTDYIMLKMGKQIRTLYITDTQIDLIINDVITKFIEECNISHHKRYFLINDINFNESDSIIIDLPDNSIVDIMKVYAPQNDGLEFDVFSLKYYSLQHITKYSNYGLLDVKLLRGFFKELDKTFEIFVNYSYNTISKQLRLYDDESKHLKSVMIECICYDIDLSNDDSLNNIYNNWWIKDRVLAECYDNEASNIDGIPELDNGIRFNTAKLKEKARIGIDKSNEDFKQFIRPAKFSIY